MELFYAILELIIVVIFIKLIFEMIKCFLRIIRSSNKKNEKYKKTKNTKTKKICVEEERFPYRKKYLLTKNELDFYNSLKIIANELDLCILSKIRLADLIEIYGCKDNSEYYKYFGKIKAKHIDFALANKENLNVVLLIEVDDLTHNREDRKLRDIFIDEVCKKCNYKILHIQNKELLREKIRNKIFE